MTNSLIKNESSIFYTVKVSDEVFVSSASFYGGNVGNVEVTRTNNKIHKISDKKTARKVAVYIGGKLVKHIRTEVITETTEELKLEEEK
ncbi:hypothetical protein [Viridibacillus arvi]|uniref:hypothetical protein n=1 Tax=Viridibacillus arvi TaxID=263475 RepID=UPI003D02A0B5